MTVHRKNPNFLDMAWQRYLAIIPSTASVNQLKETRRAFFSGAVSLFEIMCKGSDEKEDIAVNILEFLDEEMKTFLGNGPHDN